MQTIGHGSQLEQGTTGGTPTYTPVLGVTAIDFGSNKIDTVDTTDMGTAGSIRSFIPGLEDPGDISVKLNVIPGDTTQTALFTAKTAGSVLPWKVIYPGGVRTVAFNALITSIDESIPDDKLPMYTMKMKISGAKTNS